MTDVVFAGGFRVGKVQAGANYYYHLDRLGSVRLVTQTPNLETFTAKYLPYGNLYATTGAENFQYTGKHLDVSTGLYYYGYRYLDSQSGRFMTVDPHSPVYVNPQTLNQYIYALDNPNRYSDPTGAVANEIPTHAELEQWIEDDKEYAYNKWGAGKERYLNLLKKLGWYDLWAYTNNPTTTFFQAATTSATTTQWITTTATTQITTITTTQQMTTMMPQPLPGQSIQPTTSVTSIQSTYGSTTTLSPQTLACIQATTQPITEELAFGGLAVAVDPLNAIGWIHLIGGLYDLFFPCH